MSPKVVGTSANHGHHLNQSNIFENHSNKRRIGQYDILGH